MKNIQPWVKVRDFIGYRACEIFYSFGEKSELLFLWS